MPATQALLIANVVIFLAQGSIDLEAFALWPPSDPRFQPWQIVTYSFLHGGVAHIFFNMFALYTFGSNIERLFGSQFYTLYYFACVVTAAISAPASTAAARRSSSPKHSDGSGRCVRM